MKIYLKKFLEKDFKELGIKEGLNSEDVYRTFCKDVQYPVVGALINNKMADMKATLKEGDQVVLLDMRNVTAMHCYQRSLIFLFLKAASDVLGKDVEFKVCNPVNNGMHIRPVVENTDVLEMAEPIKEKMKELISQDIPFERVNERSGIYRLGDYEDYAYDCLLPSTGYIYAFNVMKYYYGYLIKYPRVDSPEGLPKNKDDYKLLEAFHQADRWETLLGIQYVEDLNRVIKEDKMGRLIQVSEAIHESNIVGIAKRIVEEKKRIILIAGPSSSGKTSFANRLAVQLQVNGLWPIAFSTDDYFIDRKDLIPDENGQLDFESLEALDIELFNRDVNNLLAGKPVDIPTFNFITGEKEYGKRIIQLTENQPIIIEGIHGLNRKLTEDIPDEQKFKIYISPLTGLNIDLHNSISPSDQRMLRRMVRDYKTRGKNAAITIDEWPKVRAGEDINIFPYINEADVFFNSVFVYGMSVLKKYAQPLLEKVPQNVPEYPEAARLLNILNLFETCKNDEIILNNSILREFIGGSIFFKG